MPTQGWLSFFADIGGLIGLAITIVGFAVTLSSVRRSRKAAERAEQAAKSARSNLLRLDSVIEIAAVIAAIEEIRRLQRESGWNQLPDKYGSIRRSLITIKAGFTHLSDGQKSTLQAAIVQFTSMEKLVEEHLSQIAAGPADPPDVAKFNVLLSKQADSLTQVLAEIKTAEEGRND